MFASETLSFHVVRMSVHRKTLLVKRAPTNWDIALAPRISERNYAGPLVAIVIDLIVAGMRPSLRATTMDMMRATPKPRACAWRRGTPTALASASDSRISAMAKGPIIRATQAALIRAPSRISGEGIRTDSIPVTDRLSQSESCDAGFASRALPSVPLDRNRGAVTQHRLLA